MASTTTPLATDAWNTPLTSNDTINTIANAILANATTSKTFDQCWMDAVDGGLQWSTLVGCFLIAYCFLFSKGELLWRVLMAHAISGFAGTLMETSFIAARTCGIQNTSLAYIILANELNWTIHEATTVFYSYIKTSVIFTSDALRRGFMYLMIALGVAFAVLRVNIGRLRFTENQLMSSHIANAHSYAFVVWGVADLVILFLLVWNVMDHIKRRVTAQSRSMIMTLLNSSIPRIAVIFFNTLAIVVVGQLPTPLSPTLANFNNFLWLVKGSYPMILLLDILMTKTMLIRTREKSSSGATGKRGNGAPPNTRPGNNNRPANSWGDDDDDDSDPAQSYQLKSITTSQGGAPGGGNAGAYYSQQHHGHHQNNNWSGASSGQTVGSYGAPRSPGGPSVWEKKVEPQQPSQAASWAAKEREARGGW
ncbi:hypothetical protein HDU96_000646 [Phlyctochytrium bullatum]|nr:hypothetical protein HDU96_000646 [Phlyctochytrium bullatum]